MKYSKRQLNAISRAYSERKKAADKAEAKRLEIDAVYAAQSVYKTIGGFVAAVKAKNANAKKAAKQAEIWAAEKKVFLRKCCPNNAEAFARAEHLATQVDALLQYLNNQ